MAVDFDSMSKGKIYFLVGSVVFLLVITIIVTVIGGNTEKKKEDKKTGEFNIWVVGDETEGFAPIIDGFKKAVSQFQDFDIKVQQFSNYEEYENTLTTVMSNGYSPDMFVVDSSSSSGGLESKIMTIPQEVINPDEFSKNFNKLFDTLKVNETYEKDGKEEQRTVLKGVPMGYESLGVFYNFSPKIKSIPAKWSEVDDFIKQTSGTGFSTIGIGLGSFVPYSPDIVSLFLAQNEVSSFSDIGLVSAINGLTSYVSYGTGDNNLGYFLDNPVSLGDSESSSDNPAVKGYNLTDLFVGGKIGAIIGYPSLLKEIQYSIKRIKGDSSKSFNKRIRTINIPQLYDAKEKQVNLAKYNYFAISKYTKNTEMAYYFARYLASKEAQEKYLSYFKYYLPAMTALEDGRIKEVMNEDFENVKYSSFYDKDINLISFNKGLSLYFDKFINSNLDNLQINPKDFTEALVSYVGCNIDHLIKQTNFDVECKAKLSNVSN